MSENKDIPEEMLEAEGIRHKAESNEQLVENFEAKSVAENISPSEQLQTPSDQVIRADTNPKPQTEKMEVHHHGHVHEKKKWKEYLFQFLMLFLAVTLGFLVENKRGHYVEQQREKQFIRSLVNDVIADTVRINTIINQRLAREQRLDSLTFLVNSDSSGVQTDLIYFYAVTPARSLAFRFIPNDGTMQQLKNSGAFRLIRNRTVADSIARYDVSVRSYLRQGDIEETLIQDYRIASAFIFDALVFDRILDRDNNVRLPVDKPPLLPFTKQNLQAWNYKMYSMKAINKANRRDARLLLLQAKNLLATLKEEYDL